MRAGMRACVRVCACVRACVCVRACMRAYVCVHVRTHNSPPFSVNILSL